MFSRILALLPLVSLAVANPLVARSDVTALETDFDNMAKTVANIDTACKAFAVHVDTTHALAVGSAAQTLDSQIKAATKDVPSHVVSDADGETVCNTLTGFLPELIAVFDEIVALQSQFKSVGATPAVCMIVNGLAKDNAVLISDLIAASPPSSKACAQKLSDDIAAETAKVQAAYC